MGRGWANRLGMGFDDTDGGTDRNNFLRNNFNLRKDRRCDLACKWQLDKKGRTFAGRRGLHVVHFVSGGTAGLERRKYCVVRGRTPV